METRKWFNPMQPQTLQGAVFLFYFRAAFGLIIFLGGITSGRLTMYGLALALVAIAGAGASYGIANEKRWGWYLGLLVAGITTLDSLARFGFGGFGGLINLMFDILLLVLLLHPISRSYIKTWFK